MLVSPRLTCLNPSELTPVLCGTLKNPFHSRQEQAFYMDFPRGAVEVFGRSIWDDCVFNYVILTAYIGGRLLEIILLLYVLALE